MKYDLKVKSLFELFEKYPQECTEFTTRTFKNELTTLGILVRQYGENFDGIHAKRDLTYNEKERLKRILERFEIRLKYVEFMVKSKHSFKDIEKVFKNKKDYEIDKIASSLNSPKKVKPKEITYKDKKEAIKLLEATEKQITDATEYLPNNNLRLIFKYTYGFGIKALDSLFIRNMLNITEPQYQIYLKEACKRMPNCIEEAKKQEIEREQIEKEEKKKIKSTIPPKTKPVIATKEVLPVQQKEEKTEVKRKTTEKKPKNQKYMFKNIFENFYTSEMNEEEKSITRKKSQLAISYQAKSSKKAYVDFCKFYNPITGNLLENYPKDGKSRRNKNNFIEKIEELMLIYTLEELQQRLDGNFGKRKFKNIKENFIENFYTSEMNEEEKKIILKKVHLAIEYQKDFSIKGYEVFLKIYDKDTYNLILDKELEKREKYNYDKFLSVLHNLVNNNTLEELQEKIDKKKKKNKEERLLDSFLDYFDNEKDEKLKEKVQLAILKIKDSSIKGYKVFQMLYDRKTFKLKENLELTEEQWINFKRFKNKIEKIIEKETLEELQKDQEEIKQKNKRKIERRKQEILSSFLDYFPEEINKKKKVMLIISLLKNTSIKGYKIFASVYEENTLELKGKLEENQFNTLRRFINSAKRMYKEKTIEELEKTIPKQEITERQRPFHDSFLDYFYEERINDEEKLKMEELVKLAINIHKFSSPKGYKVFSTLYEENTLKLKENVSFTKLSKRDKINFKKFVNSIKNLINTKSLEEIKQKVKSKSKGYELLSSFLDYFSEINNDENKNKKIKLALRILENSSKNGYETFINLYDETTWDLKNKRELNKNEKISLSILIRKINKLCKTNSLEELESLVAAKIKPNPSKHAPKLCFSFLDYFYEEKMDDEQKKKTEALVKLAITYQKMHAPKGYQAFATIYDEKTLKLKTNHSLGVHKLNFETFKNSIQKLIKENDLDSLKKKCLYLTRKKDREDYERNSVQNVINEAKAPSPKTDYLDALILRCYEICPDSEFILSALKISQSKLIDSYIRNILDFKEPDEAIDYIIKKQPSSIAMLLVSGVFGDFKGALTEKEQQLIYLRLLQRKDELLTDEKIAKILDIDVNDIRNYEIMTNDDQVNKLNRYIKHN